MDEYEKAEVSSELVAMTHVAVLEAARRLRANPGGGVTITIVGADPDGSVGMCEFPEVRGTDLDAFRQYAFEHLLGARFNAMLVFCEAWGLKMPIGTDPTTVTSVRDKPERFEALVMEGRGAGGDKLLAHAPLHRQDGGPRLDEIVYHKPERTHYVPSASE